MLGEPRGVRVAGRVCAECEIGCHGEDSYRKREYGAEGEHAGHLPQADSWGKSEVMRVRAGKRSRACSASPRTVNMSPWLGTGLVKGMVETARNFVGTYTDEARLTTVEYPEERIPLKEATRQFPFLVFDGSDRQRACAGGLPDLREGMSAPVHLHRQEQGQEARLHRQAAVLSGGVRHRHLRLHELPDLRRGLSVRSDQDGSGIRLSTPIALAACC